MWKLTASLNARKSDLESQLKQKIRSITFVIQYPYVYNVYKSEHLDWREMTQLDLSSKLMINKNTAPTFDIYDDLQILKKKIRMT